jgi:hypothetical protein
MNRFLTSTESGDRIRASHSINSMFFIIIKIARYIFPYRSQCDYFSIVDLPNHTNRV